MVTMKDVAQVMGVSVMTVSNAFNRPDQLSRELRERILERASKMGYAGPHAAARALRQGRANAFGVVFADSLQYAFADPFTVEWLRGFAEAMEERRSNIVLMSVPAQGDAGVEAIRNTSIDGIAAACAVHPAIDAARAQGLPVVAGDALGDCYVSIDELAAGRAIGEHLRALGHRDVWVLLGPLSHLEPVAPVLLTVQQHIDLMGGDPELQWQRVAGILAGLGDAATGVLQATRWDRDTGRTAAPLALDRPRRPSAVISLSDTLALGFIEAMQERGLVPGRDLSISGFDDIPEAAEAGLTTVRQPVHEKGYRTAELLLNPDLQPRQVTLSHQLLVRRSTGPVAR